ncbi:hypothetical protein D3C81_1667250 [compost metagenome]
MRCRDKRYAIIDVCGECTIKDLSAVRFNCVARAVSCILRHILYFIEFEVVVQLARHFDMNRPRLMIGNDQVSKLERLAFWIDQFVLLRPVRCAGVTLTYFSVLARCFVIQIL